MKKIIISIAIFSILAFGGWKGWNYYQSTYIGQTYYAVLQAPLPEETTIADDSGKSIGEGYKYTVDAYDEKGQLKKLTFEVITTGSFKNGEAYKVGQAFKFNANDKRIIEKKSISFTDIPSTLQEKLK